MHERFIAIDNVCAWPNLTLLPDGSIVALVFNNPSHLLAEGDVECWGSADGGRTWQKRGTAVPHEPGTARANVAVGRAHDGDIVVLCSGWGYAPSMRDRRLPPWVSRSSDGGRSWTVDRSSDCIRFPEGADREDRGSRMIKPFGDIVSLPEGGLAAAFYHDRGTVWVLRSHDDGRTWTESSVLSDRCRGETAVLRLRSDRWLAAARTEADASGKTPEVGMELFVSEDEGRSWSGRGPLTGPAQHPGHLLCLADGRILLTYGMRDAKAIGTRVSEDEGRTWGAARVLVRLETDDIDLGYPSTVELPDGTLVTAYYAKGIAQHARYHMGVVRWRMGPDTRLGGNERKYVEEVLATGFRASTSSTMMKRLEEAFAARFGTKYAISFVNGTATLHAVLEAAGIGPGDEVIVPPLTMSSTTFAVLQANATPVFADVDPDTYQIDPRSVAERITDKTRAIVTVALYGLSPDMDPIMALAAKHRLLVLEDNAQCFLGTYKGRLAGTIGTAASYSFQASKHITSGEGGMVITDDGDLALEVRRVCGLGYAGLGAAKGKVTRKDIQDPDYSRHVSMGWNYRMPELCCAVALAQLERLDELVAHRVAAAGLFGEAAAGCPWLVPQKVGAEYTHSWWTWVARIDRPDLGWRHFRDTFVGLGGDGIYAAWKLTYLEPMFQNLALRGREAFISRERLAEYRSGLCPQAESVQPRLLQFKTNYWRREEAERQAGLLRETIRRLS